MPISNLLMKIMRKSIDQVLFIIVMKINLFICHSLYGHEDLFFLFFLSSFKLINIKQQFYTSVNRSDDLLSISLMEYHRVIRV